MGSWVGHIDEAIFFLMLGIWWMINTFPRYIRCRWEKAEYTTQVSYPLPGKRHIPLEAILKTLFPLAGFVGEVFSQGPQLIDDEGNFRKLAQMQHMSIYGIFIAHGIIDILMSYGIPLPKNFDFMSAVAAFAWYGLSFSFHAHMHDKDPVETMIHVLPVYVMYVCAVAGTLEIFLPHHFAPSLVRIYCLLMLGSWFFHAAFILYKPLPLPGSDMNPAWDMNDDRNVHFIVALFGYHLIMHLFTLTDRKSVV